MPLLDNKLRTYQYALKMMKGIARQGYPLRISLLRGEQVQKRFSPLERPIEGI